MPLSLLSVQRRHNETVLVVSWWLIVPLLLLLAGVLSSCHRPVKPVVVEVPAPEQVQLKRADIAPRLWPENCKDDGIHVVINGVCVDTNGK